MTPINQTLSAPSFDRKGLLDEVIGQLKINRHGVHGPSHWARVLHHGLAIGSEVGANLLVVELFLFCMIAKESMSTKTSNMGNVLLNTPHL